jgi:hypothetical protein
MRSGKEATEGPATLRVSIVRPSLGEIVAVSVAGDSDALGVVRVVFAGVARLLAWRASQAARTSPGTDWGLHLMQMPCHTSSFVMGFLIVMTVILCV